MPRGPIAAALLLITAALLTGCATGYVLKGRAIKGTYSDIEIVSSSEDRLNAEGIAGVTIRVHRDPDHLNQKLIATGRTAADGSFAIPIDAFGAGWMQEQWLIEFERSGYRSGDMVLSLPGSSRRLLITMAEGRSTPRKEREDLWEQYERYK